MSVLRDPLRPVILAALACAMTAVGCAVGPNYERPKVDTPTAYRGASTQPSTQPTTQPTLGDLQWWEAFNDPTLKDLIHTGLANNYDLRIAVTRIEQARAQKQQAASQYFPAVGYTGGAAAGRNSFLGQPRPNESVTIPNLGTFGPDPYGDSYLAALSVAWEIDVWGRIRRLNEAALAQYLASEEARRNVTVSLVSAIAQTYFELLELDLEHQIATSTSKSMQENLDLFTRKYEGGAASLLEVTRATAQQAQVAAQIPEIERQMMLKENQLSTLLGQNPGPITRGKAGLVDITVPTIPEGLPSALLERRPDVRQAEEEMHSANAQIGVAVADFFPKIGLSALYGGASTELSDLTSSSSRTYSIGANLTGPIFEGGALRAQYEQAKAQWEQTKLQYQQTAMTAFREVADALISRQKLAQVVTEQKRAAKAAEQSVTLAEERYNSGKSAYFEVLDAQTQSFSAQSTLAKSQLNELNAYVQLYKSLGGGWSASDVPVATTQPSTQPTTAESD